MLCPPPTAGLSCQVHDAGDQEAIEAIAAYLFGLKLAKEAGEAGEQSPSVSLDNLDAAVENFLNQPSMRDPNLPPINFDVQQGVDRLVALGAHGAPCAFDY